MATDNNGTGKPETGGPSQPKEAEQIPSSPEKRELSVTTQNPSHLGNLRDPRYSQEMQKADQQQKQAKQRQANQVGAAQGSLIKEEADQMNTPEQSAAQRAHVRLPEVPRTDESEAREASKRGESRSNSPEPLDSSLPQHSGKTTQKHIRITKVGGPHEFAVDSEDHPAAGRGLDPLRGRLPYDEVTSTAFSGMRGGKRN